MECQHAGYHAIETNYDRRRGVLIFVWTCEQCGSRLGEAGRQKYRPAFREPDGNQRQARHATQLTR